MWEEKDLANSRGLSPRGRQTIWFSMKQVAEELPFLKAYLSRCAPVYAVTDRDAFVRVYRL